MVHAKVLSSAPQEEVKQEEEQVKGPVECVFASMNSYRACLIASNLEWHDRSTRSKPAPSLCCLANSFLLPGGFN